MKAYLAGKLGSCSAKQISPEQMENSRLRAELARTRMELEIVKKSGSILREGINVRYAFIVTEEAHYPREILCHAMAVSPSGFASWRRGGQRRKRRTDMQLLTLIRAIHHRVKGAYGSPRMFDEIKEAGHPVSRARVERLMRANGIRARHKRRYKATTDSKHAFPIAQNLLDRQFNPSTPATVYSADITFIATDEWLDLPRRCFGPV